MKAAPGARPTKSLHVIQLRCVNTSGVAAPHVMQPNWQLIRYGICVAWVRTGSYFSRRSTSTNVNLMGEAQANCQLGSITCGAAMPEVFTHGSSARLTKSG